MTESGTALLNSFAGDSLVNGGTSAPPGLASDTSKISHIPSRSQSNPDINNAGEENDLKQSIPNNNDEITILYYGTFPHCTIKKKEDENWNFAHIFRTARDHLKEHMAAVSENGLLPATLPLFGLIYKDHKHWLGPPMDELLEGQNQFYFRYRFRPKEDVGIIHLLKIDPLALTYLFVQCHEDFLNDRIKKMYDKEMQLKCVLGFVAMDFKIPPHSYDYVEMQKKKQHPQNVDDSSHELKFFTMYKHLPKSYRKMFYLPWRYCKLYSSLKSDIENSLNKYKCSVANNQATYVRAIFKDVPKYCLESYSAVETNEANTEVDLSVSFPVSRICLQITAKQGENSSVDIPLEKIEHVQFKKNQDEARIVIFRDSAPRIFTLKYADGLAFLSLLDGYYKLSINYHKQGFFENDSLSYFDCLIPKGLGSFGPMLFEDCSEYLKRQGKELEKRDINFSTIFMIRQSIQDFDFYEVIKCNKEREIATVCRFTREKNIDVGQSYIYSIKFANGRKDFETEADIVSFFKEKLCRQIKPNADYSKCDNDVLVKRLFVNEIDSYYDQETIASQSVPHPTVPSLIMKQDITNCKHIKIDGFLSISRVELRNHDDEKIAMIQLTTNCTDFTVNPTIDDFMNIASKLQEFNGTGFIRFYGMTLSPPRLLVEYPQYGDLLTLIRKMDDKITLCQIASAVYMIVTGLQFLDKKNLIHGNLQCKNILVRRLTTNSLHVKIGDPGLISFYNRQKIIDVQNFNRIPWIAVELFDALHKGTKESEIYSLGTLMWEALWHGKNPVSVLSIRDPIELIRYFKSGKQLPTPDLFNVAKGPDHNDACDIMTKLMKDCWNLKPQERPSFSDLSEKLTNVQRQLSTDDDQEIDIYQAVDNEPSCQSNTAENAFYERKQIHHNQLQLKEKLGDGHYGIVFRAIYKSSEGDMTVACKCLKPKEDMNAKEKEMCKKMFNEEVELACMLNHPNIVKVIGYTPYFSGYTPNANQVGLALIMEYVENGCLKLWLMKDKKGVNGQQKDYKDFMRISREIANGMAYLEEKKVIHRDLAARNILLDHHLTAKITDFGLSKSLDPEKLYYKMKSNKRLPMYWSAPESLSQNKVSLKSDVWSYGIVLWEMFTEGKEPKLDCPMKEYLKSLENGRRLDLSTAWPEVIQQIINQCWQLRPDDRPTFKQIIDNFQSTDTCGP